MSLASDFPDLRTQSLDLLEARQLSHLPLQVLLGPSSCADWPISLAELDAHRSHQHSFFGNTVIKVLDPNLHGRKNERCNKTTSLLQTSSRV